MDIYSRLYKYRERPSVSSLENFLTEALADVVNRLPISKRTELVVQLLPSSCSELLSSKCKTANRIEAKTQEAIATLGSSKFPDMIVYVDTKPLVVVEAKVHASIQKHRLPGSEAELPLQTASTEVAFQSQLKTYSEWIGAQSSQDWPGAMVLLTHGTRAPKGFENEGQGSNSVVHATRTWKDIGSWLARNLDLKQSGVTHCALASDFIRFLERNGLMTQFVSSKDLAAAALYVPSHGALSHTFNTVISAVTATYPNSKGNNNVHVDFWLEGKAYMAWYYLNQKNSTPPPRGSGSELGSASQIRKCSALMSESDYQGMSHSSSSE